MPNASPAEIRREARVRLFFRIGIIGKTVVSIAEITAGILVLIVPVSVVTDFLIYVAQGELFEDPNSIIASHVISLSHQFSYTSSIFVAFYLLTRGGIKLVLMIALLRDKLWAYPSALALLAVFVTFQIYEVIKTHSIPIAVLTILDFFVMWFIWREYQIMLMLRASSADKKPE